VEKSSLCLNVASDHILLWCGVGLCFWKWGLKVSNWSSPNVGGEIGCRKCGTCSENEDLKKDLWKKIVFGYLLEKGFEKNL